MMFCGKHHVFRAGIAENLGPRVGIPLLDLPVKHRREVVVVVVSAVLLAMIGLSRRSLQPHAVQIPFCIRVMVDVIRGSKVMLGGADSGIRGWPHNALAPGREDSKGRQTKRAKRDRFCYSCGNEQHALGISKLKERIVAQIRGRFSRSLLPMKRRTRQRLFYLTANISNAYFNYSARKQDTAEYNISFRHEIAK